MASFVYKNEHIDPALDAFRFQHSWAGPPPAIQEAFPVVPPYNSALAASSAAVKVPDSVIEQFRQISASPSMVALREFMKNAKRS
jgi:hypothetical protein